MTKFQFDSAREAEAARAFLVTVAVGRERHFDAGEELTELVRSDNLEPVGLIQARRDKPDPATYLGSGKIEEIKMLAKGARADCIVFDAALSAAQQRNIANVTELPVLDRTELILEIFRRRAKSKEGRLQVELARLEHLSTRLVRGWTHLERQRGGLGKTGGPGEKQIELDRRMIGARVKMLREQLKKLSRQRDTQRRSRMKGDTPTVSLVGYTNAGKSTLLNQLTGAGIPANNRLFDTLDTTSRLLTVSDNLDVILSDTVGFIAKLPHHLVDAFRATLEELEFADLLLHVIDASDPYLEEHIAVVDRLISQLAKPETPVLKCYNKADLVYSDDIPVGKNIVAISAKRGINMDGLLKAIESALNHARHHIVVRLPYAMGGMVETLHDGAQVKKVDYTPEGIEIEAVVDGILYGRLREYIIGEC